MKTILVCVHSCCVFENVFETFLNIRSAGQYQPFIMIEIYHINFFLAFSFRSLHIV